MTEPSPIERYHEAVEYRKDIQLALQAVCISTTEDSIRFHDYRDMKLDPNVTRELQETIHSSLSNIKHAVIIRLQGDEEIARVRAAAFLTTIEKETEK